MKPHIWVFAGPNGSGKSTIVRKYFQNKFPVVNPDLIMAKISPDNLNNPQMQIKASKQAISERNNFIANMHPFTLETTLSGNSEINLIKLAKSKGYRINIVFVALQSPTDSILRVAHRVRLGGHNVPVADIIRRYGRSMDNIAKLGKVADRIYIIDNTGSKPIYCAKTEDGIYTAMRKQIPGWVEKIARNYIIQKENELWL